MSIQKMHEKYNRLVNEKSPYLLQHAYNPVDWYPWVMKPLKRQKWKTSPYSFLLGTLDGASFPLVTGGRFTSDTTH